MYVVSLFPMLSCASVVRVWLVIPDADVVLETGVRPPGFESSEAWTGEDMIENSRIAPRIARMGRALLDNHTDKHVDGFPWRI